MLHINIRISVSLDSRELLADRIRNAHAQCIRCHSFSKARHRSRSRLPAAGPLKKQSCGCHSDRGWKRPSRPQSGPIARVAGSDRIRQRRPLSSAFMCALLRTGGAHSRRVKYRHGTIRGVILDLCHLQLQLPSRESFGPE